MTQPALPDLENLFSKKAKPVSNEIVPGIDLNNHFGNRPYIRPLGEEATRSCSDLIAVYPIRSAISVPPGAADLSHTTFLEVLEHVAAGRHPSQVLAAFPNLQLLESDVVMHLAKFGLQSWGFVDEQIDSRRTTMLEDGAKDSQGKIVPVKACKDGWLRSEPKRDMETPSSEVSKVPKQQFAKTDSLIVSGPGSFRLPTKDAQTQTGTKSAAMADASMQTDGARTTASASVQTGSSHDKTANDSTQVTAFGQDAGPFAKTTAQEAPTQATSSTVPPVREVEDGGEECEELAMVDASEQTRQGEADTAHPAVHTKKLKKRARRAEGRAAAASKKAKDILEAPEDSMEDAQNVTEGMAADQEMEASISDVPSLRLSDFQQFIPTILALLLPPIVFWWMHTRGT